MTDNDTPDDTVPAPAPAPDNTVVAPADDETTIVSDIHPSQRGPELAWTNDDETEELAEHRRSWRQAVGVSAAVLAGAGLLAGAFGAGWLMRPSPSSHAEPKSTASASMAAASTAPAPPPAAAPPP